MLLNFTDLTIAIISPAMNFAHLMLISHLAGNLLKAFQTCKSENLHESLYKIVQAIEQNFD